VSAARLVASQADRAALAEVLADPEFQAQRWRGEALRQWLAGWWERLTELLGTTEAERWADLGRAVFFLAVAVALLLAWRAARRRRARAPDRGRPGHDAAPASLPTRAVTLADAERALSAGQAAEAVRLAFLAAVGAVQRRLRAAAAEFLTGSELAERVADEGFARLARLHERTVFGRQPVTREEAAAALAVAARLVSGPGPGPTPPGPEVTR
jgi:hypothetical protein